MKNKENKGGLLTSEQVEQDLKVKGKDTGDGGYHGSQDTGDKEVRQMGTDVQKRDGQPEREEENEVGN